MNIDNLFDPNEKPLDNIVSDGGFCGVLRKIACVGDSLSSGELESLSENGERGWHDMYDYSWGQYIARMAGCTVYNFSRGGMSAEWYNRDFADENDLWNPEKACQAYIIALGVNDVANCRAPVGSIDDVCIEDYTKNKPTFAGHYAKVVQRYKEIQPDAKFFFVTIPIYGDDESFEATCDAHQKLMYDFAEMFDNSYVIDLRKYGVVYDRAFRKKFFTGGHMNAMGYLYTGKVIASYIDYIIRHNIEDFNQIGFVGTPYKYCESEN